MKSAILSLLILLLLVGCSNNNENSNAQEAEQEATQAVQSASLDEKNDSTESSQQPTSKESDTETNFPAHYEGYYENPEITDDRSLLEPGQSIRDEKGFVELTAINNQEQTVNVGPVRLTIWDAKLIYAAPSHGQIDYFHHLTHEQEFDFVKVFVEVKNTGDEPVQFSPVALLETDQGEVKLWEEDIYLDKVNGELQPGETKKGNLGFILENPDINKIEITTSDLFNTKDKKLNDAQTITIEF